MTNPPNPNSEIDTTSQRRLDYQPVPADLIGNKLVGLDGPVTTQDIVDHLANNDATLDEIATVALLPDRNWDDYHQALAAATSGFDPRER